MRECICCQCAETTGQFKDYVQCESCGLYGHEKDDFTWDRENGTTCDTCAEKQMKESALDAGIPLAVIEGRAKLRAVSVHCEKCGQETTNFDRELVCADCRASQADRIYDEIREGGRK